jgi:hypothetical protein
MILQNIRVSKARKGKRWNVLPLGPKLVLTASARATSNQLHLQKLPINLKHTSGSLNIRSPNSHRLLFVLQAVLATMEIFEASKAPTLKAALPEFPAACERAILKCSDLVSKNGKQFLLLRCGKELSSRSAPVQSRSPKFPKAISKGGS